MINFDEKIKEALKTGDRSSCETYRLIKAKVLEFKTQKNAPIYDDVAEIGLLKKMAKEREESIKIYTENGRNDLAEKETSELNIINSLLPVAPKDDDIITYVNEHYPEGIDKKTMGAVIKEIKSVFIGADGSVVANIVKSKLI